MAQAERTGQTFHSFADLGTIFNIVQPPARKQFDIERFMTLSVHEKLRHAHKAHWNKDSNEKMMRQIAARAALEMDPRERKRQRIRSIVYAPLDEQGQMIISDVFTYQIHTLFPHLGGIQYLSTSRLALQNAFEINATFSQGTLTAIDSLVQSQAELHPETLYDQYSRLIQEIKMADSLIREQKECASQGTERRRAYDVSKERYRLITARMNQLNDTKTARILEYLRVAKNLTAEFPYLSPIYMVNGQDASDNNHLTLVMQNPPEHGRQRRLLDQTTPVVLPGEEFLVVTTNINIESAMQRKNSYRDGSQLPEDKIAFEACEILGL